MNHADPNTMRARARQATEILKGQLLDTGTVESLVALYFEDHIEQVQFEDPSVLEHFDIRTPSATNDSISENCRKLISPRTTRSEQPTLK